MTDTNTRPDDEAAMQPETAPPATPEPKPSTSLDRELADMKDRLLRTLAEMENLRRRTHREVPDPRTYGVSASRGDSLNVADNRHGALGALEERRADADDNLKTLFDGVELTERELMKVLEKHGVTKIEPLGQKFDPNRHQAMYEAPDPSV